jgi:hypothetical protein
VDLDSRIIKCEASSVEDRDSVFLLVTPDPQRGALESPRKAEVRIG